MTTFTLALYGGSALLFFLFVGIVQTFLAFERASK